MADTRYLWRKSTDGRTRSRWYFQVGVPRDLQDQLGGKRVVQIALHTSDLHEARDKRDELLAEWRARFRRARERKPPTPTEIDAEARTELRRMYEAVTRDYLKPGASLPDVLERLHDELEGGGHQLVPGENDEWEEAPTPARKHAEDVVRRIGAEQTDEAVEAVRQALVGAQIAAVETFIAGLEPPLPEKPPVVRRRRRQGGGLSFREAAARYVAERMRDPSAAWTKQTRMQNEATFRRFTDFTQDVRLGNVGREEVAEFLSTIARLHPNYSLSPKTKGLSLDELLASYSGEPGLSNKTLNRHLSALSGLFRWVRRAGLYEGENPASEQVRPTGDGSKGAKRQPFNAEELGMLFRSPLLTETRYQDRVRPAPHSARTALMWVPLVALFSGLRQGEICELVVENVREQDGVAYFDVTAAKSEAGVRRVPVHSQLVRAGLLDYADHVRRQGQEYLFPGLKPGGPDGKRSWYFVKVFTRYRRDCGVTRDRVSFHSFRKNVVEALERERVHQSEVALLVGHERGFTFSVYSPLGLDLKGLRDIVERIEYTQLHLAHLQK